ncbi:MAG: Lrp/AsnC family transcriptional regulator [Bacillota bacterium]
MNEILELLEKNSRITTEQMAVMLEMSETELKATIAKFEEDGIILGYNTTINWDLTDKEVVTALIEVKVTPQRGEGFDRVAERIYRFEEVHDCYLMSGGFDLTVIVEGKTMKEVALFVAEKLAPLESVVSTGTHFVLKKYKDKGIVFEKTAKEVKEGLFL